MVVSDLTVDELRQVGTELERAALVGSKTGRPDYARMVTAEELLRWHQAYAALLAQGQDVITPSTAHMSPDERRAGAQQMMADLRQLAERDGCIAAAWAYEVLSERLEGQAPQGIIIPLDEARKMLSIILTAAQAEYYTDLLSGRAQGQAPSLEAVENTLDEAFWHNPWDANHLQVIQDYREAVRRGVRALYTGGAQGQAPPPAESGAAAIEVGPGYYDSHLLRIKPLRLGLTDSGTSAGQGQAPALIHFPGAQASPSSMPTPPDELGQAPADTVAVPISLARSSAPIVELLAAEHKCKSQTPEQDEEAWLLASLAAALTAGAAPTPPGVTVSFEVARDAEAALRESAAGFRGTAHHWRKKDMLGHADDVERRASDLERKADALAAVLEAAGKGEAGGGNA